MTRCGAYDKLFSRPLASYRSGHRLQILPIARVPVARASTDKYPIIASAMKSKPQPSTGNSSSAESLGYNMPSNGPSSPSKPGWRPYRGRWNAKVAYRDNPEEPRREAPATHGNNNQPSRRGRARQNQRNRGGYSNGAALWDGRFARSLSPRRDMPTIQQQQRSQAQSQQQNTPASFANNGFPDFSMLNPFAMFGGFPMPGDPSAFQQSFSQPNTVDQMQSQYPLPFDPSLPNPALFPILGAGNPFLAMPPLLPPAFMNFDMQSQAAMNPILSTVGQMGTTSSGGYFANDSSASDSNHTQAKIEEVAFQAPRPPSATKKYLEQSSLPPHDLPSGQPLLVILDLNGTLIHRKTKKFPPKFTRRAGIDEFLKTLVEKYKVMIWSSAQPETVDAVCQQLFEEDDRKKLVVEWGRDKLGLSKAQYNSKIQVYKTLETVWSSQEIQDAYTGERPDKGPRSKKPWDQTNTILIDDSILKAISEPYNLIEVPEFTNRQDIDESDIFPKVLQRLEVLATCDDVSKQIYKWTSANPEKGVLDLDLSAVPAQSTQVPAAAAVNTKDLDPGEARKMNRKARKAEKKAARNAASILTMKVAAARAPTSTPASKTQKENQPPTSNPQAGQTQPISKEQDHNGSQGVSLQPGETQSQSERSSSPASSDQSGNSLLDRLEESLN